MPSIGKGVEEIRIWDDSGTYRVVYTARLADAVYVLHAFQKKTQTTSKRDIDTAKHALGERGPVWWDDGSADFNRHKVRNTPYAQWYEGLQT